MVQYAYSIPRTTTGDVQTFTVSWDLEHNPAPHGWTGPPPPPPIKAPSRRWATTNLPKVYCRTLEKKRKGLVHTL